MPVPSAMLFRQTIQNLKTVFIFALFSVYILDCSPSYFIIKMNSDVCSFLWHKVESTEHCLTVSKHQVSVYIRTILV